MTLRQSILKLLYPFWMFYNKLTGRKAKRFGNKNNVHPPQSFYNLSVTLNNGSELKLDTLRSKKIMLVNTASDCGFTSQYDDLQKLHEKYKDKLMLIGFPANDFKQQEKGTDEEIAEFCKLNFRSEEHTSELQSQSNLVCRLLLEKKKKKTKYNQNSSLINQNYNIQSKLYYYNTHR